MESLFHVDEVSKIPCSDFSQIVCVGNQLCNVAPDKNGYLSVSIGNEKTQFKSVPKPSVAPTNRINFSLSELSSESFILSGGDGSGISTTEFWLFNIKTSNWTKMKTTGEDTKRRGLHKSVIYQSETPIIYIFGGKTGFESCTDLIIGKINTKANIIEIIVFHQWPNPRIGHSMTIFKNSCYIFGGTSEDGIPLSDLWELDLSLFVDHPVWKPVIPSSDFEIPSPRSFHTAWSTSTEFFIAGGLDVNGHPLNDIWLFNGSIWTRMQIFITTHPIFHAPWGLCEYNGSNFSLCRASETFSSLDPLFSQLRHRQSEFSALLKFEKEESEKLDSEIKSMPLKDSNDFKTLSLSICDEAVELSTILSKYLKKTILQPSFKTTQYSLQLDLYLEQIKTENEKRFKQLQLENQLYKEQLKSLGGEPTIPDLNPSNFKTLKSYLKGVDKTKYEAILANYYEMQLHHYATLLAKIKRAKSKKTLCEEQLIILKNKVSCLTKELNQEYRMLDKEKMRKNEWIKEQKKTDEELAEARKIQKEGGNIDVKLKQLYDKDHAWISKAEDLLRQMKDDNEDEIIARIKNLVQKYQ